jgi:hypothetical protein
MKSTLPYSNLYEFIMRKLNETGKKPEKPFNEVEVNQAIRKLEMLGGVLQTLGSTRNPTIRFIYED